jgi:hypothetical protein
LRLENSGSLTFQQASTVSTSTGQLTLGATGNASVLQGSTTSITSNGAGNDITLTSADQIFLNSVGTIELQDNTNVTGDLDVSGGLNVASSNAFQVSSSGSLTSTLGNAQTWTITPSLTAGARSSDVMNITQANDGTNDSTGNLLELNNQDTGSTGAVLNVVQAASGLTAVGIGVNTAGSSIGVNVTGTTTGNGLSVNTITTGNALGGGAATTSGTMLLFNLANNTVLTSGSAVRVSGAQSSNVAYTGAFLDIQPTKTVTGATTINDTGNFMNLNRSVTNNGSGTVTLSGALANLQSTCGGSGTCTDTATLLNIAQNNASASGTTLVVTNAGTGNGINVISGASSTGVAVSGVTTGFGFSASTITTGYGFSTGSSMTSGIGYNYNSANIAQTTARALNVSGTASGALSAYTGSYVNIVPVRELTSGSINDTGSLLNLTRSNTVNNAGSTFTVSGDVATLQSSCTVSAGTCTDTGNVLSLNQQYASSSGAVLDITNAGTGAGIQLNGIATDITTGTNEDLTVVANGSGIIILNDTVAIGTLAAADTDSALLCRDASSGQLSACGTTGVGAVFVQGGNTFGAQAVLGTNDSNSLAFETNNIIQATIAVGGAVTFQNSTDSTSGLRVMDADGGNPVLNVDTSNERVGIGTATPGYKLTVADSTTADSGENIAGLTVLTVSPSSVPGALTIYEGTVSEVSTSSSNLSALTILTGQTGRAINSGSGTLGVGTGLTGLSRNTSTGIISNAIGVQGLVQNTGAGSITVGSAVYASSPSVTAGSITTAYGLYIEQQDVSGVGTGYGIYQSSSTDNNYFAGRVGIGGIDTGYQLSVSGNVLVQTTGYSVFSSDSSLSTYGYFRAVNTSDSVGSFEIGAYDINGASQGARNLALNPLGGNVGVGDSTPAYLFTVGSGDLSGIDSSGNVIIKGAGAAATADLSFGVGANRTINVLTQTAANTSGNSLTLQSATGNGTGTGGSLQLTGGTGGATNAAGGDVILQGGAAGGAGTTTGSVIVKSNTNNTANAFQIQLASGTALFTADTTNKLIKIGTGSPTITSGATGALFVSNSVEILGRLLIGTTTDGVDTTSGQVRYAGTYRNAKKVTLAPEFAGAVLTGDGTNNTGTMTSDFCSGTSYRSINTSICAASEEHNYYSWTAQATNDYDVWTKWQVPSDFSAFAASNPITFYGSRSSSSTGTSVTLTFYNAAGTVCGTATSITNTTTWSSTNYTSSGCTPSAGDVLTIRVTLSVGVNNEVARIGEITINYLSAF